MKFLTIRQSWDPLAVLHQRMREHLSRLLDSEIESRAIDHRVAGYFPLINISETNEAYLLVAELPGVKSDDLNIDISEEGLTIECRRSWPEGVREESFRRQERWHGSTRRHLTFAKRINPDEVSAELQSGVLTMRIPKSEPARRRRVDVTTK